MSTDFEAATGVKLVSLVFAFVGAALGISYAPQLTKRTATAALIAGLTFGAFGPELVSWLYGKPLPLVINNVTAVIFGIGGMFIVPGIIFAWREFSENPWAILDKLRGKGGQQ